MGAKPDYIQSSEKSNSTGTNTIVNGNTVNSDEIPPIYYNSEPSGQPPIYSNNQTTSHAEPQAVSTSQTTPTNQHRTSAPASTIAAVLASGYDDLDAQRRADRKKKSLRQRWKDFKERNFGDYDISEDRAGAGSAAEWNVQGGRMSGGLASPYRKRKK
jgi:hypothetical protein